MTSCGWCPCPNLPPCDCQVLCVLTADPDGAVLMSAKVTDFGLALRALPLAHGGWDSVSVPPRGTRGYMAPELTGQRDANGCVPVRAAWAVTISWACGSRSSTVHGQCEASAVCVWLLRVCQITQMVDVYSFGILLAFLFTGKSSKSLPSDEHVVGVLLCMSSECSPRHAFGACPCGFVCWRLACSVSSRSGAS